MSTPSARRACAPRCCASTGAAGDLVLTPNAIEPEDVAEAVLAGIADDRFLILPHPEVAGYYAARAAEPERWLGGMNKLQRSYEQITARAAERTKAAEAAADAEAAQEGGPA